MDGIPIIIWDDLNQTSADILIVAAGEKHYKEIFDRIADKCAGMKIDIYGANGQNLWELYRFDFDVQAALYYQKNADELRKQIDTHDAISFDLFDTLIMRKTLEPTDVFDLVEEALREQGISIPGFKKIRRTAELESKGGDIHCIYQVIGNILGMDEAACLRILKEELRWEKSV